MGIFTKEYVLNINLLLGLQGFKIAGKSNENYNTFTDVG